MQNYDTKQENNVSLRIGLSEETVKRIAIIATTRGIEGKKNETTQKVVELAVNNYFKEVVVKELENL